MRRKDLERKDPEFLQKVLGTADEIYVAFSAESDLETGQDKAPYVVPLNFVFLNDKIYFHCALKGRKLDCIKANPSVGFSTAIDIVVVPEEASTLYKSVIGTGVASLVEDLAEKGLVLDALAQRYAANCEQPATAAMLTKTAVVRIDIESICGKEKTAPVNLKSVLE